MEMNGIKTSTKQSHKNKRFTWFHTHIVYSIPRGKENDQSTIIIRITSSPISSQLCLSIFCVSPNKKISLENPKMNEIQSMKQRHSLKTPYTSNTPETRDMRGNVWAWGLLNVDIFMVGHTGDIEL